ncbi:MAG: hypothetical protein JNN11_01365 [Candidatus Doudnabacteria bacterium]|nr:hypothetical protein [Candidatus Doudnabacteria bacterium]
MTDSRNLDRMREAVFNKRPVLREIEENFGDWSLKKYIQEGWELSKAEPDAVFLKIVEKWLQNLYGPDLAKKCIEQLRANPLVSTVGHLGLWGHPIFLNADVIYTLHFNTHEFAVLFSCESVSLNNTSSWSGSVIFHENSEQRRFSFFPDRLKTQPVFYAPSKKAEDIKKFKEKHGELGRRFAEAFLVDTDLLSFSLQACKASNVFWQKVFPSAPKTIFLPVESVAADYLLEVFKNPNHILTRLVFSEKGQSLWKKYLHEEHTYMFWGIDAKGRREPLKVLPEDIIGLLKARKIYPSSPLYFVVFLLTGFACVGGFTQTTWLSNVKSKFISMLEEMGEKELALKVKPVPTKNFGESTLVFEGLVSAMDLYLKGKDLYQEFSLRAEKMTLKESMNLAMPTIYSVVVPKEEQGM